MPKSKKKKNQDFQKVKLKVGRRLQKADNITNASFKTRSVQVVQHIKTGDGTEPTTRRNLNIRVCIDLNVWWHTSASSMQDKLCLHVTCLCQHTTYIYVNMYYYVAHQLNTILHVDINKSHVK